MEILRLGSGHRAALVPSGHSALCTRAIVPRHTAQFFSHAASFPAPPRRNLHFLAWYLLRLCPLQTFALCLPHSLPSLVWKTDSFLFPLFSRAGIFYSLFLLLVPFCLFCGTEQIAKMGTSMLPPMSLSLSLSSSRCQFEFVSADLVPQGRRRRTASSGRARPPATRRSRARTSTALPRRSRP